MKKKILFILFLGVLSLARVGAQLPTVSDSAKVSIITHSPWQGAIYALFGHAAIRIKDPATGLDVVYNYGIFSFSKPNFIYRFAKGETDYMVEAVPFDVYAQEYEWRGQDIFQQTLRLSSDEKRRIADALFVNALPENREYRYNFFFDNCATRLFQMVEKHTDGEILLPTLSPPKTFRNLTDECLTGHDWAKFGINLVLGMPADKVSGEREAMFLPRYLRSELAQAQLVRPDGVQEPLVLSATLISPERSESMPQNIISPMTVGLILLALAILVSVAQMNGFRRTALVFDTLLFAVAGVAGLVLTFLMFFSVHPCMSPNFNYLWLNPLQLLVVFFFFAKSASRFVYCYHFLNFALLTAMLVAWKWIPQSFEVAFVPFVLALWVRSAVAIFSTLRANMAKNLRSKRKTA